MAWIDLGELYSTTWHCLLWFIESGELRWWGHEEDGKVKVFQPHEREEPIYQGPPDDLLVALEELSPQALLVRYGLAKAALNFGSYGVNQVKVEDEEEPDFSS